MNPIKVTIALLAIMMSSGIINAAEVRSISREIRVEGATTPSWYVNVKCAGIEDFRVIERVGNRGKWCSSTFPNVCLKQKVKLASKVCGTHFGSRLKSRVPTAQSQELVKTAQSQKPVEKVESQKPIEKAQTQQLAEKLESPKTVERVPEVINSSVNINDVNVSGMSAESKQKLIEMEEQRILIEEQRIQLRLKEIELKKKIALEKAQ